MLPQLEEWFEWAVANRLNRIQWILLGLARWGRLADAEERQNRLHRICDMAHSFGLACGAVVPLADMQQHGWFMVNTKDSWPTMQAAIHRRIDWVVASGFDFLSTESGLSEFTHPPCQLMLDLLNEFAVYANTTWGKEASVKVHCSTGQSCQDFRDPRPKYEHLESKPALNFNFLPAYAHPPLGIMPHTVQPFALDDDTHNVYGNANFSDMLDYMFYEAEQGRRKVIWYGESSYWVSVDIDVPLFLPVFAHRRIRDLRTIAGGEQARGFSISGQVTFSSGWEWAYWINEVAAARASWNPKLEAEGDALAMQAVLGPALVAAFGHEVGAALSSWLASIAEDQVLLLLRGDIAESDQAECLADNSSLNSCTRKCGGNASSDDAAAASTPPEKLSREDAQELFKSLDGDGDGTLYYKEIKAGMARLRKAGVVQGWLWASELLAGADGNEDDSIDEEEFWLMLGIYSAPEGANRHLTREQSDALFRQLDGGSSRGIVVSRSDAGVAKDARLHYGEIKKGMKAMRKAGQVSQKLWASQFLSDADTDGSHFVDPVEFYEALKQRPIRHMLSGLAYLSGWDTWAELPRRLGVHMTQANKVLPWEWSDQSYAGVVPLLSAMVVSSKRWLESFRSVKDAFERHCGSSPLLSVSCMPQRRLLEEIEDAAAMTHMRARHVLHIYTAGAPGVTREEKARALGRAREILEGTGGAGSIVRRREAAYRVPAARVASWRGRPDPTAYRFGYLYAVSSLYFWWRDQGRAEGSSLVARRSPCYLNRMDPTEIAFGWDKVHTERLKMFLGGMPRVVGFELGDCLAPPERGFVFPRDL